MIFVFRGEKKKPDLCHSDHGPYKPPALALLSLYYII